MKSVCGRYFATLAVLLAVLLTGCARHLSLADMQASIPPIAANQGRIWFYRSVWGPGSTTQPAITLNGRKVGTSVPGGFFYVDTESGPCVITTATEIDYSVKFLLEPNEERFVRTVSGLGFVFWRIKPELVDSAEGRWDLASKYFTGPTRPAS